MEIMTVRSLATRLRVCRPLIVAGVCALWMADAGAQELTGTLIGTVKDAQGGVVQGAVVTLNSPALIGGAASQTTNDNGQWRFTTLPPGPYVLDIQMRGFSGFHEESISIAEAVGRTAYAMARSTTGQ